MSFVNSWKRSVQPRKQRKYRYQAPLHIRNRFVSCHLSETLRKKQGIRSLPIRVGDKVKVYVGQFRKKTGRVNKVDRAAERVFIDGIDLVKKDGTRSAYSIHVTNLEIIELNLDDKKRLKNKTKKEADKTAKVEASVDTKKQTSVKKVSKTKTEKDQEEKKE